MENFNFNQWLAGVEYPTESVEVYTDFDAVERVRQLREAPAATERAMGEPSTSSLLEEAEAVLLEHTLTFHMAAISREDRDAVEEAYESTLEMPEYPEDPPKIQDRATAAQAQAYSEAWEAYGIARERWNQEHREEIKAWRKEALALSTKRGAELLAKSIVYVSIAGGPKMAADFTADEILLLEDRIGIPQMDKLVEGMNRAAGSAPDPFSSPNTSASTRD